MDKHRVIVGLSGGRDSVALAHYLYEQGREVVLAHMNFHLRGEESQRDENFVRELQATRFPIATLVIKDVDTYQTASSLKISVEMAARTLRYHWFEVLRLEYHADCIAVGHHADDQIETVLLNLARGTGGTGLMGMKEYDDRRHLWRPFLSLHREDIDEYIRDKGLPYVDDSTNAEEVYRRNYIRHTLIPAFEQLNPSFRKSFNRSISYFQEEQKFISDVVGERLQGRYDSRTDSLLLTEEDITLPSLVQRRLFTPYGFNDEQVISLSRVGRKSGVKFQITSDTGRVAESFRGRLFFYSEGDHDLDYQFSLKGDEGTYEIPQFATVVWHHESYEKDVAHRGLWIDGVHLRLRRELILRRANSQDRFTPFGMKKGSKHLFDYLKDKGIPPFYRDLCPVLVDAQTGEILAVLPLEVAESVRISETTDSILDLSLIAPQHPLAHLLSILR